MRDFSRQMVESIRKWFPDMEIVYRPHPSIDLPRFKCRLDDIPDVRVETYKEKPIEDAVQEAAVVLTISSSAAVQVNSSKHGMVHAPLGIETASGALGV